MVRVLYLNPFSQEVSGPDESLRGLLGALIPDGVEAHVVLPAPGPQVVRYEALGATDHFAPLANLRRRLSFAAAAYPASLARATAAVAGLARRLGADIVHTNMEVLLEGGLAAKACRIPHVLHYRGNTLDRPKLVFDALARVWEATADQIYCISHATAGVFERRNRARKVEVLYNPVDVATFSRAERSADVRRALGAAPGQRLVGTVGRVHPRKDLETFVRAAALVAAEAADVRFVIVGTAESPDERAYEARIAALARELGVADRLTFAQARRDIPAVMAALDAFVLCSRHEGFGRVVAEAMAAARPIVVTDEGALPELVDSGRLGLVAPPEDPAGFAGGILALLRDADRAARLGREAAEAARQFDVQVVARRVSARYRALVGLGR